MFKFSACAACILAMTSASLANEVLAFPSGDMVIRAGIEESGEPRKGPSGDRWTGFYAGLSGAYALIWDSQDAEANGMDFGGFAGYNVELRGPIVGGLEAEYMRIGREFDDFIGVIASETFTAKMRVGYAHDRFFGYAMAGAQHAVVKVPFAHVPGLRSADTTYVLGLGVDVAVTNRIALGAEYSRAYYTDFDRDRLLFPLDARVQRFNARLSYKIN